VDVGSAGSFITNGGAAGTPSSIALTNATGLPISTGVTGLGSGVDTWLAAPTPANFAAAMTATTGTGAPVLATEPTITGATIDASATLNAIQYTFGAGAVSAFRRGLGVRRVVKSASLTRSIAAQTADPDLQLSVVANVPYLIKLFAGFSGVGGAQMSASFNNLAITSFRGSRYLSPSTIVLHPNWGNGLINTTANQNQNLELTFIVTFAENGTVVLSWGAYGGTGTGTIFAGSYLEITQMNL
jgi:hypothetical protein